MQDRMEGYPIFRVDWMVLLIFICLLAFGWISICGASHEVGDVDFLSWETRTGKQLVWIFCAFVLGFVLLMIDERYFPSVANFIYWVMMAVLLITPFIAKNIKGSYSWISLGPVNLQPAEFAKCATALAIAKLAGQYGFSMHKMRDYMKAIGLIMLPMVLIILQKETGSALVYFTFFLMLYREGMPGCYLFTGVAAVAYFVIGIRFSPDILPGSLTSVGEFCVLVMIWVFTSGMAAIYLPKTSHGKRFFFWGLAITSIAWLVSVFIVPFDIAWIVLGYCIFLVLYLLWMALEERIGKYVYIALFTLGSTTFLYSADYALNNILQEHQQNRVKVLLGMVDDIKKDGYNVNQSKIAIGSGGLLGKGFMNGTQTKLKYVPEQDTDFIFCTVGEEEGFIGSSAVLLLFMALILRLIHLAEKQTTAFGRIYGYCVLSILFFHVLINIGMVMGLMPVIGIPLPFFSYGGSSLWGFTLMLFIFLRIDADNKLRIKKIK